MKLFLLILIIGLVSCSTTNSRENLSNRNLTQFAIDSARHDFEVGNRRLFTAGLPAFLVPVWLDDSICNVFHFTDYNTGCVVSDSSLDFEATYNKEMKRLLEKLNGKNWESKHYKLSDSVTTSWESLRRNLTEQQFDSVYMVYENRHKDQTK